MVTEVEGILKTTPLTYVDEDTCHPLRPVDFIQPLSLSVNNFIEQREEGYSLGKPDPPDYFLKEWSALWQTLDFIWGNWKNYVKRRRPNNPQLIEIVMVEEDELPRVLEVSEGGGIEKKGRIMK